MSEMYSDQHRAMQQRFDTSRLADRLEGLAQAKIPDDSKAFIESRDMFFLTSVDHRGYPTRSYKGGARGFVRGLDPTTIVFPSYNANGMFLSLDHTITHHKIAHRFISFNPP